jgi:hypothetical protein
MPLWICLCTSDATGHLVFWQALATGPRILPPDSDDSFSCCSAACMCMSKNNNVPGYRLQAYGKSPRVSYSKQCTRVLVVHEEPALFSLLTSHFSTYNFDDMALLLACWVGFIVYTLRHIACLACPFSCCLPCMPFSCYLPCTLFSMINGSNGMPSLHVSTNL